MGLAHFSIKRVHMATACLFSRKSSKPRGSPVYPVLARAVSAPLISTRERQLRAGSGSLPLVTIFSMMDRERGPCMEIMATSKVLSSISMSWKFLSRA